MELAAAAAAAASLPERVNVTKKMLTVKKLKRRNLEKEYRDRYVRDRLHGVLPTLTIINVIIIFCSNYDRVICSAVAKYQRYLTLPVLSCVYV